MCPGVRSTKLYQQNVLVSTIAPFEMSIKEVDASADFLIHARVNGQISTIKQQTISPYEVFLYEVSYVCKTDFLFRILCSVYIGWWCGGT